MYHKGIWMDKGLVKRYSIENSRKFAFFDCSSCLREVKIRSDKIERSSGMCRKCAMKKVSEKNTKHGEAKNISRLYKTWSNIKSRCASDKYYVNISVCDEWLNSYEAFRDWSMLNNYSDDLTIDRIDNNGNYEPSNCRWTTQSVQSRNTRVICSSNTSGYRGVSYDNGRNKYVAHITINYRTKFLGRFENAIDAAYAYNKYVDEHKLEHTKNIF